MDEIKNFDDLENTIESKMGSGTKCIYIAIFALLILAFILICASISNYSSYSGHHSYYREEYVDELYKSIAELVAAIICIFNALLLYPVVTLVKAASLYIKKNT